MPSLELGTFVLFNAMAVTGLFLFGRWNGVTMLMSALIFAFIAAFLISGYDVVSTQIMPAFNTTTTSQNLEYAGNGTLLTNSTKTEAENNPSYEVITPIIDSNQFAFGWLYLFLAFSFFLIWIWRSFQ